MHIAYDIYGVDTTCTIVQILIRNCSSTTYPLQGAGGLLQRWEKVAIHTKIVMKQ